MFKKNRVPTVRTSENVALEISTFNINKLIPMPRNKHSITGCCFLAAFNPQHSFFPSPHTLHQGAVQVQLATSHLQNQGHLKGESEAKHLALPITAYNIFGSFGLWARIVSSKHVQTFQMTLTSKHQKSNKTPLAMESALAIPIP